MLILEDDFYQVSINITFQLLLRKTIEMQELNISYRAPAQIAIEV